MEDADFVPPATDMDAFCMWFEQQRYEQAHAEFVAAHAAHFDGATADGEGRTVLAVVTDLWRNSADLTSIDLSGTDISDDELVVLAACLTHATALQALNLLDKSSAGPPRINKPSKCTPRGRTCSEGSTTIMKFGVQF